MDREWQPGGLAKPLNELLGAVNRQGRLALAEEQKAAVLAILADQLPDQAQLVPSQPVDAWRAVLGPTDVQRGGLEVELLDRQGDELGDPQCVAIGQEDQEFIPDRVAFLARGLPQALDLRLGQVFARPKSAIWLAPALNCRQSRLR